MATLSELTTWLEALRKARATGVRSVTHGDTTTEYRSDKEMARAISDLERQIAALDPTRKRARIVYFNRKAGA